MNIADIGRLFSIGTLVFLALGVLLWAVLKLLNHGFAIPPILAIIASGILLLIAANFYLSGLPFSH